MNPDSFQITVLSADPGFASFGYAIVGTAFGADTVREMGVFSTEPTKHKGLLKSEDSFARLRELGGKIGNLATTYKVDALCFESLSIPQITSKQNAIKIGYPYGILGMLAVVMSIPVIQVTPQAVKKALCGRNNASKEEVQTELELRFRSDVHYGVRQFQESCPQSKRNHAWDALGVYVAAGQTDVMKALKVRR